MNKLKNLFRVVKIVKLIEWLQGLWARQGQVSSQKVEKVVALRGQLLRGRGPLKSIWKKDRRLQRGREDQFEME